MGDQAEHDRQAAVDKYNQKVDAFIKKVEEEKETLPAGKFQPLKKNIEKLRLSNVKDATKEQAEQSEKDWDDNKKAIEKSIKQMQVDELARKAAIVQYSQLLEGFIKEVVPDGQFPD